MVPAVGSPVAVVQVQAQDQQETQPGNPYVRGIASHAWWLDPEVYGDQLFPAMEDLGVTTVRVGIDWKRFEPVEGQYDWSLYDRVLGELARRHMVIVANFNTIPGWASTDERCNEEALEIYYCQLAEDKIPAYERAVRAVLERYAWIQYWEFWNEPEMWRYLGEDATVYLRHLRIFYDIAHQVNPEVIVCANTLVGVEYMEYVYNLSELYYGDGNEPWDALSIHPYVWAYDRDHWDRPLEINYDRVLGMRALQVARGDADQQIWITEYGWNNGVEQQTENLVAALDWMKQQPWIGFAHLHMLHDWNSEPLDKFGLMEIVPDENGYVFLGPDTEFRPRQPFYDAFKQYERTLLPRQPNDPDRYCFAETGHCIEGRFLKAWNERGGLRIMGLPMTRPYPREQEDGSFLLVQDFERARLEFHPKFIGGWGEVLGTLIGNEITAERRAEGEEPFRPLEGCANDENRECFAETGHSLAFAFRAFWQTRGGLAAFGYPISEEFPEKNPDTGEIYTVQYFERARFEYHPEHEGTEFAVLLGRLIGNQLEATGWGWPPEGSLLPTAREFE
jgi:hypothetical protein